MSDRTPPGIKPGSDGRGWRALVWIVIAVPAAVVILIVGLLIAFTR
jgi:hypothetical protein